MQGINANCLKNGLDYVVKINELFRATGRMRVEDVALTVGINLKDKTSWETGLQIIIEEI